MLYFVGSDVKSTCPNPILGRFDYTIENPDGTKSCEGDEDLWDGCKDNKMLEFNYTACPAKVANSGKPCDIQVLSTHLLTV